MLKWRRGPTETLSKLTLLSGGTVGAPSLAISEADTGLYLSGADTLGLTANGTLIANVYGGSGAAGAGLYLTSDTGRVVFGVSWDTKIERSAANTLTTGVLNLLTPVLTYAADQVLTAALCQNSLITVTATATITLPAVTGSGMCVCIYSTTAAVISVDANANDRIVLDGTALDDGDKVTCDAVAGNWIVLFNDTNVGWRTLGKQGAWVDGGA